MKNKKTLKLLLITAIILLLALLINLVKADGTGSLVINLELDEGTGNNYPYSSYFNYMSYQLKDSNDNPITFDDTFATANNVTIENGTIIKIPSSAWTLQSQGHYTFTLSGIPNGTYKFELAGCEYSEDTYAARYNQPRNYTENPTITINGGETTVNEKMVLTLAHSFNLYYLDQSGHTPNVTFQFASDTNTPFTFTYSEDDDGNNVYTYDTNSTNSDILVVSGERTIVKEMPGIQACSYRIKADLKYGDKLLSYSRGITCSETSSQELYSTAWDSIELPYDANVGYFAECANVQKAAVVEKKANDGTSRDCTFRIRDTSVFGSDNSMKYDYYETYDLYGVTYSNVYVLNGEHSETPVELSTINGKATIIYPQTYERWYYDSETRHSYITTPTKFAIYETGADNDVFYDPRISVGTVQETDYEKATIYDGNVTQLDRTYWDIDYSKFESTYDEYSGEVKNVEIIDVLKPRITKKVVDENGNEIANDTNTYTFGLYAANKKLLATVTLKANETKYFDVQMTDNTQDNFYTTSDGSGVIKYIAEIKKGNSVLKNITSDKGEIYTFTEDELLDISEDIYAKACTYRAKTGESFAATFTNQVETIEISGEKTWDDSDNAAGKRPSEIVVILLADGTPLTQQTVRVNQQGKWTYKFDKLPKYKNGIEITYSIDEMPVELYDTLVDGFNLINKLKPDNNTNSDTSGNSTGNSASDESNKTKSNAASNNENSHNDSNTKTGDNIIIYYTIAFAAILTLIATKIKIRKREQ